MSVHCIGVNPRNSLFVFYTLIVVCTHHISLKIGQYYCELWKALLKCLELCFSLSQSRLLKMKFAVTSFG